MRSVLKNVHGQPSWVLESDGVEACVTEQGGHVAPVTFKFGREKIQPYHIAPWAEEPHENSCPEMLKLLRGDFFCLPFGGNDVPYKNEKHPPHGETSNAKWKLNELKRIGELLCLRLGMDLKVRRGHVEKQIWLHDGQHAVYSRHVVSGAHGVINLGHHANLQFPDESGCGLVSTAPFELGQVFPGVFENPANGGYQALKPGAFFKDLNKIPTVFGTNADCSRYPARRGYTDLIQMVSPSRLKMGWTAVSFPKHGYVWFALKDPRVLRSTLLWHSNGGRHYAPWSGRHVNCLGLEEITSYFHEGLAQSAKPNPYSKKGIRTVVKLNPRQPLVVNYIMAVAQIPRTFGHVKQITPAIDRQSVSITDRAGRSVRASINVDFLGIQ